MMQVSEPMATHAVSADGTPIGYRTSGTGTPLVLVHGTASLHATWNALLPYVQPHFTVHAVDRRGRGASGDGPRYELEREFEDIAAVVDAVAQSSGTTVNLLGHSFGGLCALGAARLTSSIGRLVVYEGWPALQTGAGAQPATPAATDPAAATHPAAGIRARLDELLATGDLDGLLETFLVEAAGVSAAELGEFRAIPGWWSARLAVAHTIPREFAVEGRFEPEWLAAVTVPTLMLVGGASPDSLQGDYASVAAAMPDVRVAVIDGQRHLAHVQAPARFADQVLEFFAPA